jgi:hypothetical protein
MQDAEEALENNNDNVLAALASTLAFPEEDQCIIIAAPSFIKPAEPGGGAQLSAVLAVAALYLTFDAVYSSIAPAAAGEPQLFVHLQQSDFVLCARASNNLHAYTHFQTE